MRRTIFLFLLCALLSGCTGDEYESAYSQGYEDGKNEGISSDEINEYLDWDTIENYVENEGSVIVSPFVLGQMAGEAAGALAKYPIEDLWWQNYRDYGDFESTYLEFYFEAYDRFCYTDEEERFNYENVYMINTSGTSEAIRQVGYDEYHSVLLIRWAQGDLYAYEDVGLDEFKGIISAESLGNYANDKIKDKYEYYKIEE